MSESPEVQAMLDKWYILGKKARREYSYSFRSFVDAQSAGLSKYQVPVARSKFIKPACVPDPLPEPEPVLEASVNVIQELFELRKERLVEVDNIAEQIAPIQPIEWAPVQKKAIERRERLERMRLEALAKRGKTEYKKTTREYLQALRSRAEKKGMDFDLTPEWLESKMALEFCEATGLRFEGKGNQPYGRTVDRKDSSIGYTMENCWATCWLYNRCKMEHSHQDVLNMARSMVKLNENDS